MDCKRILKEYLQDYQIAEEQLVPCLYQQKNCVCVILEKIGYRKSSGEPLPKIGIMIDVDTKKIIGEVSEMDFEKYHLYGKNEETESITEEFLIVNNLPSMEVLIIRILIFTQCKYTWRIFLLMQKFLRFFRN